MGGELQSGALYVVATPIGNLEDMTFRGVRILREVDRIACEDTRITRRLCDHFGVDTPLMRHEAHNEAASTDGILALLEQGEAIALVSDAGTPCINDPGQRLIGATITAGYPVIPIPGASSLIVALSASGLPTERFIFHGFLPKKERARSACAWFRTHGGEPPVAAGKKPWGFESWQTRRFLGQ
ncbi:MAG: 16S rRNA (cytidine(1402)-2'-O)-methyltransferase, partial [Myxococcota bacterium]|nr:16S rRNA (cytidine(1402)-2'-O)-methyltransferase [Myxococcota bacterium]